MTWETSDTGAGHRAHWLVVDKLAAPRRGEPGLDDVNLLTNVGPMMFEHTHPSGRVDLVRKGNTVTASTRGVAEFTLLVAPDAFDLSQPIKVVLNGRTVHDARVEPSLPVLLKWAARDNDRTMLFAAELHVKVG